jgi:hypothetical protein
MNILLGGPPVYASSFHEAVKVVEEHAAKRHMLRAGRLKSTVLTFAMGNFLLRITRA